jgi:tRNA threonylcarbamoyladenosine biosynthesis protein TsaB
MLILALDTSTRSCSIAVVENQSLIAEATVLRKQTHSIHLMEMLDQVLQMGGIGLDSVEGFAVIRGPGSFTGLRIGISTVKGLAEATRKPLVGVSSLRALACQAGHGKRLICPMIDARKGELYFTRYRYRKHAMERLSEIHVGPIEEAIGGLDESCLFIGDGALLYKDSIRSRLGRRAEFASPQQGIIRASTVAFLSIDNFIRQETDDSETFAPRYIRKSEAEFVSRPDRCAP